MKIANSHNDHRLATIDVGEFSEHDGHGRL